MQTEGLESSTELTESFIAPTRSSVEQRGSDTESFATATTGIPMVDSGPVTLRADMKGATLKMEHVRFGNNYSRMKLETKMI